jgi:hypothetical protein
VAATHGSTGIEFDDVGYRRIQYLSRTEQPIVGVKLCRICSYAKDQDA